MSVYYWQFVPYSKSSVGGIYSAISRKQAKRIIKRLGMVIESDRWSRDIGQRTFKSASSKQYINAHAV
jgi:hypothetical protein